MSNKKKAKPKRFTCVCMHSGGAKGTRHAGGAHGIPPGYGKCLAKGCRCRRFMLPRLPKPASTE